MRWTSIHYRYVDEPIWTNFWRITPASVLYSWPSILIKNLNYYRRKFHLGTKNSFENQGIYLHKLKLSFCHEEDTNSLTRSFRPVWVNKWDSEEQVGSKFELLHFLSINQCLTSTYYLLITICFRGAGKDNFYVGRAL